MAWGPLIANITGYLKLDYVELLDDIDFFDVITD